jgi:hypothetical protein
MTVFGQIIDGDDVEAAAIAHLEAWLPTYVAEVVRQKDPKGELWPKGVAPVAEFSLVHAANENWPEDQLPMLLFYSPGMADEPIVREGGLTDATYRLTITAIASGFDTADAKRLGRVYASAAMMAMMQHPALGDFGAESVRWVDLQQFPITRGLEAERNLMAVAAMYEIVVSGIVDRNAGVAKPLAEPDKAPEERPEIGEDDTDIQVEMADELP